jgi:predicted aminopeptidase
LDLLNRKQDIQALLDSPHTPAELKRKLKLVKSVRKFALLQLAIPENEGYSGYVELDRPYVTMVVTAAPKLELKAHKWCYLFIGCQEYRGYFDEGQARTFAEELQGQELDVSVSKITAYSTLGWLNKSWMPDYFSDPVLSTFLRRNDAEMIAVLIHEMAHQVVYVNNDTSFNESFAVFVEQEGLRQFLRYADEKAILDKDREKLFQWYLKASKDRELFRHLINSTFEEMDELFSSELANAEKLRRKQQLFDDLRENYKSVKNEFRVLSYDNWFEKDLNNNHLLGVKRYHSNVDKFERLFDQHGKDWREFFQVVRELAAESLKERNRRLSLLN